ncbi:MAG: response regulator [Candidatus Anammoxibacter sp.]
MANILVIDDDECIHDSFKMVLEPANRVESVYSGEEGISKATMNPPDIIFLDLKMSGICGAETLMQLQTICPGIPTFIMSGHIEEYEAKLEQARDSGCLFEVCSKPMDSKQIAFIVGSALSGHAAMVSKILNLN